MMTITEFRDKFVDPREGLFNKQEDADFSEILYNQVQMQSKLLGGTKLLSDDEARRSSWIKGALKEQYIRRANGGCLALIGGAISILALYMVVPLIYRKDVNITVYSTKGFLGFLGITAVVIGALILFSGITVLFSAEHKTQYYTDENGMQSNTIDQMALVSLVAKINKHDVAIDDDYQLAYFIFREAGNRYDLWTLRPVNKLSVSEWQVAISNRLASK